MHWERGRSWQSSLGRYGQRVITVLTEVPGQAWGQGEAKEFLADTSVWNVTEKCRLYLELNRQYELVFRL